MPDIEQSSETHPEEMTLGRRAKVVLSQNGEPMTYRDLITALWSTFPEYRDHSFSRHPREAEARREVRTRLGGLVRNNPDIFTATKADGIVLVGLAATSEDVADDAEEDEDDAEPGTPSVYWYTFPAYQRADGPYPIKIGWGKRPTDRIIRQSKTAMPEHPIVLGTREHVQAFDLERALHAVLVLRGRRIRTAPGAEWFSTTPAEVAELIGVLLG
ncbi:hypothetical protein GIW81_02130 [Hyphomicrobium sp. xq]|uniref:Bacteriophage T5 Orf172 DNA-binding domain-containing protein n=1 Tax=Hyphomicrobium album TaxID=2665159 RepID=A0A6I3KEZ4_9HYPH|nr:GIY-YIG nuclease family protein [Hyphomicrobium album]MTD93128.1 hypothetical protein [Hyphomicrobium album]